MLFLKNAPTPVVVIFWISMIFVVWKVWQDPTASVQTAGDFFSAIGGFVSDVIDKSAAFLKELAN